MERACADCGKDISTRHHLAKVCFPCAKQRQSAPWLVAAHKAVSRAVRSGALPSPKTLACEDCGKQAMDYDHRDYSKPLQVAAVCRGCNKRRGPGIRPLIPETAHTA